MELVVMIDAVSAVSPEGERECEDDGLAEFGGTSRSGGDDGEMRVKGEEPDIPKPRPVPDGVC